jgi:hypothetical protein
MENTTTCSNDNKRFKVVKVIKIPMYSCIIQIIITDDLIKTVNSIYKKYKIDDVFSDSAEGCFITTDIDMYMLCLDIKYLTHNTIAHEIYHAVPKLTADRDINDEEAQAWLCGWLTEQVYKFIDKKQLIVK